MDGIKLEDFSMISLRQMVCAGFVALLGFGTAVSASRAAYAQSVPPLPLDTPTDVNGVEAACTGVSADERSDPRWDAYGLKVVLAGKGGQFLGDADITVARGGQPVVTVFCGGPWVLFKLPPARYEINATINGESEKGVAYVPASGQARVIIRFLNQGGAMSPEEVAAAE